MSSKFHLILFIGLTFQLQAQYSLGEDPVIEAKADSILALMTLDEKIGQMTQAERNALSSLSDINTYALGSLLSGGGSSPDPNTPESWATMYDNYQSYAMQSRLKIPLIYGIDAVHGHSNVIGAVLFPHNIGLGCVQDTQLIEDAYYATAVEVRGTGMNWAFSPCIAVARDERWGRTYESYGETEIEAIKYGSAAVRGLQGTDMSSPDRVVACAKHFIGDGGTTNGTDQGNTQIDEEELRRLHLPGYEAAIAENVGTIMASYNSWNGVKCHGSEYLLTTLLKEELGFNGFIISDWAGIDQITGNYKDAIEASINAGVDMVMVPYNYVGFITYLKELVNESRVSQSRIDDAVKRILRIKLQSGLFENPYTNSNYTDQIGSAAHRELARQCVQQSQVLLKNKDLVLPLSKADNIVVAGANADNLGHQCGGWSISWQGGSGDITNGTTILEGIQDLSTGNITISQAGTNKGDATVGVIIIGESPYAEGAGDNSTLALSDADINAVTNIYNQGIPVVVVLVSGRPLILEPIIDMCDAFVTAWLPGTEGQGVADLLYGDITPSGQLCMTWPRNISQVPINIGDEDYNPLYEYGAGITNWNDETVARRPTLLTAKTDITGTEVVLSFNKTMADPASDATSFEIKTSNSTMTPASAKLMMDDKTNIILHLSTAISATENNITISYTEGSVKDEDNLALLSFSDQEVLNYVSGAAPILLSANTNDAGNAILLNFNKAMQDPSASVDSFTVKANGQNSTITTAAIDNSSKHIIILSMAETFVSEDALSISYSQGSLAASDGGLLNTFNDIEIVNMAPGAPPVISSASTDKTGKTVGLIFDKLMESPSGEYQNFDIKINNVQANIISADLRIAVSPEMLFTIEESIVEGDVVTVSYTPGSIKSLDGGVLEAFTDYSVELNLGNYITIPARLEAEDYTDMQGLETEDCQDTGKGLNIGYINAGDWWEYDIHVPESKNYQFSYRNAAFAVNGDFNISIADDVIGQTQLQFTGGWQNWQTTTTSMFLEAGYHTIRFTANNNDFNFNWIEISEISDTPEKLYADYESTTLNFTSGTSTFNTLSNPYINSSNNSSFVGEFYMGDQNDNELLSEKLSSTIDFSSQHIFTINIYSPEVCSVVLRAEASSDANLNREETVKLANPNEWETLSFDLAGASSETYDKIALTFKNTSAATATYYIDNIAMPATNNNASGLTTQQGVNNLVVYPNPTSGLLNIDAADATKVYVYNVTGQLQKQVSLQGGQLSIADLEQGVYFINVNNQLTRVIKN